MPDAAIALASSYPCPTGVHRSSAPWSHEGRRSAAVGVGDRRALDVLAGRVVPVALQDHLVVHPDLRGQVERDVVRDHRHRNRGAEPIGLCDRPSRQVAAVGQARDAEAIGIGDAERDARVDAGHHVLEVHPTRVPDHRLRERAPPADAPPRVRQQARVAGAREQDRVRLRVREERTPVPGRPAVHERQQRQRALRAFRRHQQALDLQPVRRAPPDRAHVGEHGVGDNGVVERGEPGPLPLVVIEPRELGWLGVRLVRGPHDGATVGDRALRLGYLVADERVAAPALIDITVERDPATRRPGPIAARVPKGLVVDPLDEADGLQARPGVGRRPVGQVDDHHAAAQQPRVARVALDHGRAPSVRRKREPLERPGRPVEDVRGAFGEVEPRDDRSVPPRRARILRDERDHDVVGIPVEFPHAHARRPDLGGVAGREVDLEQASARLAGPDHGGIGTGICAPYRASAPVEAVATGVGREHQQAIASARPRDRLGRAMQVRREHRLRAEGHRVRELMAGGDPIGKERQPRAVRRPRWTPVAPNAARDLEGRIDSEVDEVEIARWMRPDIRDRRVKRERDLRSVRSERELHGRPNVEQPFVGRVVGVSGRAHGGRA